MNFLRFMPAFILSGIMVFIKFWIYSLGLNLPILGLKKNHFGCSLLIDVAEYDVENLFWALSNSTNSNLVCVINKQFDKALPVDDGKVEIRKVFRMNIQLDSRFF